ncbi:MAG: zinc transporter ZupT [Bacteroidales bacterium]|nr:zinc transporter ZupT [Bacteroidales bacterium]MDD4216428.1 zinc transporter ZupT [Bacteroidales bacterium]MDY0143307.1 zinc transporter ZupT [Bacteroidales bacterium]
MDENFIIAFSLTLFAGLSTGIGSLISFFASKTNTKLLSFSLGLSGGVMLYISFVEMLPEAVEKLTIRYAGNGPWYAITAFFGGMLLSLLIDRLVPEKDNPHEVRFVESMNKEIDKSKLHRMGILTAIAITIHNFPEGIATFVAAYSDLELGIPIALAVAIHNIPEGIAVAVPIYFATGNRRKAMRLSFLSGLAEPLGALLAFVFLMPFLNDAVLGIVFAVVSGIMVFISFDELLPGAQKYGDHHIPTYGVVIGMAIMAFSLLLLS